MSEEPGTLGEEPEALGEEPETKELQQAQSRREAEEQDLAESAADEEETVQHERRAEKARYLKDKLEERARSERERD